MVSPTNPQYLVYAYAPVVYGRSTSALHDVPMLMYGTVAPASGGAHVLSYVVVFSHEDGGTGFLPFVEWGTWGRMTDIDNAISFTVKRGRLHLWAQYLWGGEHQAGSPTARRRSRRSTSPSQACGGAGTRYCATPPATTTSLTTGLPRSGSSWPRWPRLHPARSGEAVMDTNPFSYEVMADEVARWYTDISTSPSSLSPAKPSSTP